MEVQPVSLSNAFNPFPGLRFFELDDTSSFFGREGQSDELLHILDRTRFVAIVGSSGSGKSSLVYAGLLPALYGGMLRSQQSSNWRVALMRPGNDPIGNLARGLNLSRQPGPEADTTNMRDAFTEVTLRHSSRGLIEYAHSLGPEENLLIVVDQFEELFRFTAIRKGSDNAAAAFIKLLLEAARHEDFPIYVVLTMRSDFLGDCAQFQGLIEAINEGQFLIPRLSRDQRSVAITGPVAVAGAQITPRLVNRLLNDVGDNADQLPIMQHTLMRTWDHWAQHGSGEPLDIPDYVSIGGMSNALSRHADEAYHELPDDNSRSIAERVFKALIEQGDDNRVYRRPTRLLEICRIVEASFEDVIPVIENFRAGGRSFLMPPPGVQFSADTIVDISHESLIRNWERLSEWVSEEANSARVYERLAESATLYHLGSESLLRYPALQIALDWREGARPNETWAARYHRADFGLVMGFLEDSRVERDAENSAREEARWRELKQTQALAKYQDIAAKRLRLLAVALVVLLVLSLGAAVYAFKLRSDAMKAREAAYVNERAAITARDEAQQQKERAEAAGRDAVKANQMLEQLLHASDRRNSRGK
jgi:energy-coupling factor transporter ATP-binding protein EcfA2